MDVKKYWDYPSIFFAIDYRYCLVYNKYMLVYRYLSENELNNIKAGKVENIGKIMNTEYIRQNKLNTHHYRADTKYLHFFRNKDDIRLIKPEYYGIKCPFYYCTFDIPRAVLFFARGYGRYIPSGYDVDYYTVREYAIPTTAFDPKWLVSAKLDKDKDKHFEFMR